MPNRRCAVSICLLTVLISPSCGNCWRDENFHDMGTAEEFTTIIERHWTIERIKEFCRPETRTHAGQQNLVTKGWEGELHKGTSEDVGRVYWYGEVWHGKIGLVSVNVQKGEDHWILEIDTAERLARPLDKGVLALKRTKRIFRAMFRAHWLAKRGDDLYFRRCEIYLDRADEEVQMSADGETPIRCLYRFKNAARDLLAVDLDEHGAIKTIYMNGKKDPQLNHVYRDFMTHWVPNWDNVWRKHGW